MKFSIEDITPEIANEYLEQNIINRNISVKRVDEYAYDMAHGAWQLNGEAIRFDKSGKLIDGQHRLLAIAKCGKPVRTVVMRDVDDGVTLYDRGRNRSVADVMIMDGMDKDLANTTNASIAKLHFYIQAHSNNMSDYRIRNFIEKHKNTLLAIRPLYTKGNHAFKGELSTRNAPFLLACMYAIESGESIQNIIDFAKVYSSGLVENKKQSAAIICRNDCIGKGITPSGGIMDRVKAERVYEKSIYDFCRQYPRTKTYRSYSDITYSNNIIFKESQED